MVTMFKSEKVKVTVNDKTEIINDYDFILNSGTIKSEYTIINNIETRGYVSIKGINYYYNKVTLNEKTNEIIIETDSVIIKAKSVDHK
jgi:hypothetical protein